MKYNSALRQLSNAHPEPTEIGNALHTISALPDYAIVLVTTAIIESMLQRAIVSRGFKNKSGGILKEIFDDPNAPLATFSGKTKVAHAFGVITPALANDLDRLRHVRNAFAHAKLPITLETTEVRKAIRGSKMFTGLERLPKFKGMARMSKGKANYLLFVRFSALVLTQILGEPPPLPTTSQKT